jgi:DNA (cytosine-5)-methyltransferase 1
VENLRGFTMSKVKVLNLYAGIGGNRKLWDNNKVQITAVEKNESIAKVYSKLYPNDKVIIGDAHEYLLKNYNKFEFIWSSPPCPTHSRVRKATEHQNKPVFPDMQLYEEILFLKGYFKGKWVVENVISWYDPLIKPFIFREHYYWSNFVIDGKKRADRAHNKGIKKLEQIKGFDLSEFTFKGISKEKVLRNCVEPEAGKIIFDSAFNKQQTTLGALQ